MLRRGVLTAEENGCYTACATNRVPVGGPAASRSRALQLRVEASRSADGIWHRYLYPLVAVPSTQASERSMRPDQDAGAPRTDGPSASGNGLARKALARTGTVPGRWPGDAPSVPRCLRFYPEARDEETRSGVSETFTNPGRRVDGRMIAYDDRLDMYVFLTGDDRVVFSRRSRFQPVSRVDLLDRVKSDMERKPPCPAPGRACVAGAFPCVDHYRWARGSHRR